MSAETAITMPDENHVVFRQLCELGLADPSGVELLWPHTRDSDIPVLRDRNSGVIFLAAIPDLDSHYGAKSIGKNASAEVTTRSGLLTLRRNDDLERRLEQTAPLLAGADLCDFGTGQGQFLDAALGHCRSVAGVEIRDDLRELIAGRLGDKAAVLRSLGERKADFDVVTMFHVLEHIPDQLATLREIRTALRPGGTLFVEVPHARDFLITEMQLPEFCDFTFWSEHLVLHTKESLAAFLHEAGFTDIRVNGFQRYGFANHLHWIRHHRPGGHEAFGHLSSAEMDEAYGAHLRHLDRTDTLIATATASPA